MKGVGSWESGAGSRLPGAVRSHWFFLPGILLLVLPGLTMAQEGRGVIDWVRAEIVADVGINLAQAGVRLPGGRLRGEELLADEYLRFIRTFLLRIPVDSSNNLEDRIRTGEYSFTVLDALIREAGGIAPALSRDLLSLRGHYTIDLDKLSAALIGQRSSADIPRAFQTVPTGEYSSIIVIAQGALPILGRKTSALPLPCLFPRIWDTEMNLIYEKSMSDSQNKTRIVRYARASDIFRPTPSGLEGDLAEFAGPRPFRVIARGVYGINPTDLIIDRASALEILSSGNNRMLLRDCKVIFVLPDEVLETILSD